MVCPSVGVVFDYQSNTKNSVCQDDVDKIFFIMYYIITFNIKDMGMRKKIKAFTKVKRAKAKVKRDKAKLKRVKKAQAK